MICKKCKSHRCVSFLCLKCGRKDEFHGDAATSKEVISGVICTYCDNEMTRLIGEEHAGRQGRDSIMPVMQETCNGDDGPFGWCNGILLS
jgi:hypothetical protein